MGYPYTYKPRASSRPATVCLRRPPYITMGEAARIFNIATASDEWDAQKARRFLTKRRAAIKLDDGPRAQWLTTRGILRDRFPDIWEDVMRILPEDEDDD